MQHSVLLHYGSSCPPSPEVRRGLSHLWPQTGSGVYPLLTTPPSLLFTLSPFSLLPPFLFLWQSLSLAIPRAPFAFAPPAWAPSPQSICAIVVSVPVVEWPWHNGLGTLGDWRRGLNLIPQPTVTHRMTQPQRLTWSSDVRDIKSPLYKNMMALRCIITKADISTSARRFTLGLSTNIAWSSIPNAGISLSMRIWRRFRATFQAPARSSWRMTFAMLILTTAMMYIPTSVCRNGVAQFGPLRNGVLPGRPMDLG